MVNHDLFELFQQRYTDKQIEITYDGGTITNSELFAESMQLTEKLCSDKQLKFGKCEASIMKFKIANVVIPLFDKWITVTIYLDGNRDKPFMLGRYKVASDTPTADRKWRDITAYDAMYDILNADVAEWYNTVLPNEDSKMTLKEFRTSFLQHFGLEQEDVTLINDSMTVEKTVHPSEMSGKDVITAICEINGCFGHIGRDGKFKWIYLPQGIQGLYPANDLYPANNLYPAEPKGNQIALNGSYTNCKYSDFLTKTITKLQIRASENDIGAISGDDADNCYIIEDNFLVYGKGKDDFQAIADNIMSKIKGIIYRPFQATVQGNPYFEVGDAVRFHTKYELIESYVLNRTLKGVQALKDTFTAKGEERYSEKVNSVRNSIIQLKGKTNELERNVEETRSTITDVEKGLQSQITQNAEYITAEVKRAQGQEVELAAAIKINADNITLKVSKGDISSEISQEAGKISIKSNRFSLESDNTTISEDGTIECKNIKITGGSIQIETALDTYDFIKLKQMASSGNWTTVREATLNPYGLECKDVSGGCTVNYSGNGVFSENTNSYCKVDNGYFNKIYASTGSSLEINPATTFKGTVTVEGNVNVSSGLSAQSITVKPLAGAQFTLKTDTVKSMSSVLGLSTKQITVPAGYMFSSNVTFTYNSTVNGYVLSTLPILTQVTANTGYIFANDVSFADKNVVGY